MDAQSREITEIHGSEPEPRLSASGSRRRLSSGGAIDEGEGRQLAKEIQDLGWGQLLGRVVLWLSVDLFIGCAVYFISCGKECKDHFSGVTGNTFADSIYFSSTTLTTTGFGDIAPTAPISKALTAVYIACNTFYINFFVYPPFIHLVHIVEGRNRGWWRRFLLALCYCLICLFSAIPFLICLGALGWGNAFYTVVVSFSSTGYGDYTFAKMWGRLFNSLWLLVSHLVNYRLGGLVTDAGDASFSKKDDDARDQAAAAAAALAAVEREKDAAIDDRNSARVERAAAAAGLAVAEQERDAAVAAKNSAREELCTHLVRASLHMQAADERRAAAEERLNELVEGINAAVQQTVDNFVLMLTDAYFEAAVLEGEKVELAARLKVKEYDLCRLQNPT